MRAVLPRQEAAEYVGCKDAPQFVREVRRGVWPKPIVGSHPPRWSRAALDQRIAELDQPVAASPEGLGDIEWEKFA